MPTSVALSPHFENFIRDQVEAVDTTTSVKWSGLDCDCLRTRSAYRPFSFKRLKMILPPARPAAHHSLQIQCLSDYKPNTHGRRLINHANAVTA